MRITESNLRKIIHEELEKILEQDAQEIEMPAASVIGIKPPDSVHAEPDPSLKLGYIDASEDGSFDLDVSFVGGQDSFDKFVHIGKLSEIGGIVSRYNPDITTNTYVPSSMRSHVAGQQQSMKRYSRGGAVPFGFLVDVGCNGFYLVGVSAGQDQDGNDIPIIIYLDQTLTARFTKDVSLERDPGAASKGESPWAIAGGWYANSRGPVMPGVERVIGLNTEGFGVLSRFYVINKSMVKNYPFDPDSRPGCEATRNFGKEIFVSQEEDSQEVTPILTQSEEAGADTEPNTKVIKTKMKRWCDQFPDHPVCRY